MKRICERLRAILAVAILGLYAGGALAAGSDEMIDDALAGLNASLKNVPQSVSRVAVARIETSGDISAQQVSDRLNAKLLEGGRFSVIDRASLARLLEEQKLSMSGLVDTAQMVSAGKLTGVQGFFFGSAHMAGDRLVLDLKLVDVETSAIVYARNFNGESLSKRRFGLGWLYANNAFGTELRVNNLAAPGVETYELEGDASTPVGLTVSCLQGLKRSRSFKFGADASFARYQDFDGGTRRVQNASHVAYHDITVYHLAVKPKIFFSGKRIFNTKNDFFNPYLGAAFNYYNFLLFFDAENFTGAGLPKGEAEVGVSVIGIAPLAGAEFNLTPNISAYAEFSFDANLEYSAGRKVLVSDVEMESFPYAASGAHWGFGLKYYF